MDVVVEGACLKEVSDNGEGIYEQGMGRKE